MDNEKLFAAYAACGIVKRAAEAVGITCAQARRTLTREGVLPVKVSKHALTTIIRDYSDGKSVVAIAAKVHKQHYEVTALLMLHADKLTRAVTERSFLNKADIPAICADYHSRMKYDTIIAKYGLSRDRFRRALALGGADKRKRTAAYRCKQCDRTREYVQFGGSRKTVCRECDPTNPSAPSRRAQNAYYVTKFGITLAEYESMEDAQGHKCAICGIAQGTHRRKLAVDHCHTTGKVRGLLCVNCNTFLGFIEKTGIDPHAAIAYLEGPLGLPAATATQPPTDTTGQGLLF